MHDEAHRMAERLQLAEHGIEDERPVQRRKLDCCVRAALEIVPTISATRTAVGLLAPAEEIVSVAGDGGERLRVVFDDILARAVLE